MTQTRLRSLELSLSAAKTPAIARGFFLAEGTHVAKDRAVQLQEFDMTSGIHGTLSRWHGVKSMQHQSGKLGWILLWALGVPIPILLILFLMRGCT